MIAGAALAGRGLRVLVFDRDRVGAAHREWNISQRELASLVGWGIFSSDELRQTVATHYDAGLISFDATGTGVAACPLEMSGVLDVALDAQRVLDLARRRFLEAGGQILENTSFRTLHVARRGAVRCVFEVEGPGGTGYQTARLAIDMMGSVSPVAMALNGGLPFDGVCPADSERCLMGWSTTRQREMSWLASRRCRVAASSSGRDFQAGTARPRSISSTMIAQGQ